jgi:hypothetical protein
MGLFRNIIREALKKTGYPISIQSGGTAPAQDWRLKAWNLSA